MDLSNRSCSCSISTREVDRLERRCHGEETSWVRAILHDLLGERGHERLRVSFAWLAEIHRLIRGGLDWKENVGDFTRTREDNDERWPIGEEIQTSKVQLACGSSRMELHLIVQMITSSTCRKMEALLKKWSDVITRAALVEPVNKRTSACCHRSHVDQ